MTHQLKEGAHRGPGVRKSHDINNGLLRIHENSFDSCCAGFHRMRSGRHGVPHSGKCAGKLAFRIAADRHRQKWVVCGHSPAVLLARSTTRDRV